jgi:ATP-dependent Lon protease
MTGEITLRGRVLPVGGVREKVLAAHRAGIHTVILPKRNVKDLIDVPKRTRAEMKIVPVEHIDQVLEIALLPKPEKRKPNRSRRKLSDEEATGETKKSQPTKPVEGPPLIQSGVAE